MARYRIVERLATDAEAERRDLLASLTSTPASIPPKYFYDALGCALFGAICELDEYYPTRTERAIFEKHRTAIAAAVGRGTQFVDLGAGDGAKAMTWLPILAPARYIAVDIAASQMERTLAAVASAHADLALLGVVADFGRGLDLRDDLEDGPVTFFYPGSSIGNFAPPDALAFLRTIRNHCAGRAASGLLIGVDTKKAKARLDAAYDDATGVTAAFNRNVLNHINHFLGADFSPRAFAHRGFYNEDAGRVEMHLEALSPQTVRLGGVTRAFATGERIHTENSWKYTPDEFIELLRNAGFDRMQQWQDEAGDFAVFYAA
jgi:dimethylhistidine N-methyltransferase